MTDPETGVCPRHSGICSGERAADTSLSVMRGCLRFCRCITCSVSVVAWDLIGPCCASLLLGQDTGDVGRGGKGLTKSLLVIDGRMAKG